MIEVVGDEERTRLMKDAELKGIVVEALSMAQRCLDAGNMAGVRAQVFLLQQRFDEYDRERKAAEEHVTVTVMSSQAIYLANTPSRPEGASAMCLGARLLPGRRYVVKKTEEYERHRASGLLLPDGDDPERVLLRTTR